ncbi:MAG: SPOR domain-containing protein [Woeseiaceae bacterium]|nr:SPOR domain-containing protein [Woeseiaceae bacterium]
MPARRTRLWLPLLAVMLPVLAHAEANVALDNILLSKVKGITTVQIWPACRMRYVDHSPFDAGLEVRIRVTLGPDCTELFDEIVAETYAPSSLHLGNVAEVAFERFNPRDTFLVLRFREPQKFDIRQHSVGWIEVHVDTTVPSNTLPAAVPAAVEAPQQAQATTRSLPEPRPRPARPAAASARPSSRVNVPPSSTGDYVVQLGVFDDAGQAEQLLSTSGSRHFAYRSELSVNGRTWYGLQLGFFDSENDAEQVLDGLRDRFPDAWVRFVDADEAMAARAAGDLREAKENQMTAVAVRTDAQLTESQLTALMADGRAALLERRYADAIRTYSRVLEVPGHQHRAEAREMLAIAFERSARTANAVAEYRAFLAEFPDDIGQARVADRLRSLEATQVATTTTLAPSPRVSAAVDSDWQMHGGISVNYWRNQEQRVHKGNYLVSSSGVLTLANLSTTRRGDRFDIIGRFNGAYQFNLVEFDRNGDIGWVSNAFVDVLDRQLGIQARAGRQTRRDDGVLNRFDGIGVRYQWKPDVFLSASAGLPVDSPRFVSGGERYFYAASARFEDLWRGRISANAFTHQQFVDGIADRQAIGGEVLYSGEALSVLSLLDFDVSYNVLNSLLVSATWMLDTGWSLSGRVDVGAEPFLTTRNALNGQSVTSVDDLLETWTEAQVRTLARDRTAQGRTFTAGLSMPMGERFDFSFDATMRQLEATVASGGVAARPDTGNEFFFNATIVASSLFLDNDLLLMSVRQDVLAARDSTQLILDARLPVSRNLRISPRIELSRHERSNTSAQTVIEPSLRLLLRWGNVLFDIEAGGRWSNRDLPPLELDPFTTDGTEELLGGFVSASYRWEF